MAYNIIVPFQGASPGVFPAQNNENFLRLRDIIDTDHNFQDASAPDQGIHNQCTMINRANPVGPLAAGSGILFSNNDSGASELKWYNGASLVQITPGVQLFEGIAAVTTGSPVTVFADPGYSYQAYCWLLVLSTTAQETSRAYLIQPGGTAASRNATFTAGGPLRYTYGAGVANDLTIDNTAGGTINIRWAIQISRLT